MDEALFRKEAIAALARPAYGRPVAGLPRSWCRIGLLLALTLVAATLFAARTDYVRSVEVRGWLVASDGVVRLTSARAASVAHVHIVAGDRVEAGQALLTLNHDTRPDVGTTAGLDNERSLGIELDALARRRDAAASRFRVDQDAAGRQIAQLALERAALERQQSVQTGRLERLQRRRQELDEAAARGAIAESDALDALDAVTAARLALADIERQLIASERALADAREAATRLPLDRALAEADALSARLNLEREQTVARATRRTVITAPVAATVETIEVGRGSTVRADALLATLAPDQGALSADLYVTSDAAAFIRGGHAVELRLDAFPHQRYGTIDGTVSHAANAVLLPGDVDFPLNSPAYRVRVRLARQDLKWRQQRYSLRSGMQFSATVVVSREPLLVWLVAPLTGRLRS